MGRQQGATSVAVCLHGYHPCWCVLLADSGSIGLCNGPCRWMRGCELRYWDDGSRRYGYSRNLSISLREGKENNGDSLSSGERNGKSPA